MLKTRLSCLLVTLPLVVMPLSAFAVKPALASGAAEEAVRILAKARAADDRCSYLSASERNELQRFSARAEIAAANQGSASSAKAAAAAGRTDASGVACSPDTQADVRETLNAARQAVAAADSMQDQSKPQARRRTDMRQPDVTQNDPARRTGKGLGFYAEVVKAYYLERQCRSLPRADADRFWRRIVSLHNVTVAENGKRAVARVMANARNTAATSSCGRTAVAQIRVGYDEILSR